MDRAPKRRRFDAVGESKDGGGGGGDSPVDARGGDGGAQGAQGEGGGCGEAHGDDAQGDDAQGVVASPQFAMVGLFFVSSITVGRLALVCGYFGRRRRRKQWFKQCAGLSICEAALRCRLGIVAARSGLGLVLPAVPLGRSVGPVMRSL